MTPERASEIERICQATLGRPVSERAAFLSEACAGDVELRRDVERLLAHDDAASSFLETPAMDLAAQDIARAGHRLTAGERFGPYTIVSRLGAGGMGEVYRARDATLGREVAIKVLPPAFTADPERLARLEREARVLAALNHPNIATIHGLQRVDGGCALVLEVVEGETLEERLLSAGSGIPLTEALGLARQIAEALEAAHESGIVHRDLKPANIKIRPDGLVKVLDFGLAKVSASRDGVHGQHLTHSPTVTWDRSREGTVLGTAAYMSPEQAQGKRVDRRSDIWAFGVILYEMLTGRRGFRGETTMDVLSNVLKAEPDWTALPPAIPAAVRALLRRSLQKDPARRLRDIADARFQIEDALHSPADVQAGRASSRGTSYERMLWVAVLIAVAAVAAALAWTLRPRAEAAEVRLEILTPPTIQPTSFALSPDGQQLVFVASAQGRSQLWLRSLDSATARPLPATENARFPFWSPDGRSVAFASDDQLKRVEIESGSVRMVASGGALGGTWNRDGTIVFTQRPGTGLYRVSADGGDPQPATRINLKANNHLSPQFLPDDRRFLFYSTGTEPGIYVGELGAPDPLRRLLEADAATYAATSGQLLFVRAGTLFAQAFDPVRLELGGSPVAVAEQIAVSGGTAGLSSSAAGPIVYRMGPSRQQHQFVWFDRSGAPVEEVAGSDFGDGFSASLSHDERQLAIERVVGTSDIWTLDMRRGVPERLTTHPSFDLNPIWSPDDRLIAFTTNRRGPFDWSLYIRPASSNGDDEVLVASGAGTVATPADWSPDGRLVLYSLGTSEGKRDIWAVPVRGERKPFPVLVTPFNETSAQFSQDGQWIAYQSNESGSVQIYIQRYPAGRKVRVSTDGGIQARWRRDGKEMFYITPDNRLVAVPIRLDVKSDTIDVGRPVPLFTTRLAGQPQNDSGRNYMVSADGQRFLLDTLTEVALPMTVILNWKPRP